MTDLSNREANREAARDRGLTWDAVAGMSAEEVKQATTQIREEEAREEARAELDAYRDRRREAWIAAGGTEEEFRAVWPSIKGEYLYEKTRGFTHEEKLARSNLADMKL